MAAPMTSSPVKPKKAPSAYFLFAETVRPGLMEENKKVNCGKAKVAEVAKAIGDLWTKLAEKDKAKFEEKAKQAKEKQATEMQAYKEANDPLLVLKVKYADLIPRKPTSAYWMYAHDDAQRSKAEKTLQESGEEATLMKITAELGKMWKALGDEKALWNEKAKKAAAEYEEKRKIWEATSEFVEFQRVEKEQKDKVKEEKKDTYTSPKKEGKRKAAEDEHSTPAAKKPKVEKPPKQRTPAKVAKSTKPQAPVIEPDVLKKAQALNLEVEFKNLMRRSEISAKDFPQAKLLDVLEKSEGLVNKAKHVLLGV